MPSTKKPPLPEGPRFGRAIWGDLGQSERQEWWLANGLGAYAAGTVSEIFDSAPPHLPRGAPAQAWSVACTLGAWWRLTRA